MLDQPLKNYLHSLHTIPFGARDFCLSIIGTGAFLAFRTQTCEAENDHWLEYFYRLETSLCFDMLLNHTIKHCKE